MNILGSTIGLDYGRAVNVLAAFDEDHRVNQVDKSLLVAIIQLRIGSDAGELTHRVDILDGVVLGTWSPSGNNVGYRCKMVPTDIATQEYEACAKSIEH